MLDFETSRTELVKKLINKGIKDKNVLNAINSVPRHKFVLPEFIDKAYEDHALPIIEKQTISQPYTVAYMTALLNLEEGDKVLEIGTGSGYQAAILYKTGANVYSVERIPELFEYSKKIFNELNYVIHQKTADGNLGWIDYAPYDRIIITAAVKEFPVELMKQLKINGLMVLPIGDDNTQTMNLIKKIDEFEYKQEKKDRFKFVPLIGKYGWTNG